MIASAIAAALATGFIIVILQAIGEGIFGRDF